MNKNKDTNTWEIIGKYVYFYNLWIMGRKEPYVLSEKDGVKLSRLIAFGKIPRIIIISGELIVNLSSFSHLERVRETVPIINQYSGEKVSEEKVMRELSPAEEKVREEYNNLEKQLKGQEEKLLE